ncbi:MAG: universal stress protein [Coriobacteriia bacterium]|nr:universal stress protein [Coriobacteriia bacterium]
MLKTVLVPTDFSDDSSLILDFARGLPALGVKRVVLAHVVDASGLEGPVIAHKVDRVRDWLKEVAPQLEAAGLGVEIRVPAGDPFDEIVALAAEMHVDAIVSGSHAKSIIDQLFVGSISERLLRDAAVPSILARFELMRNVSDASKLLNRFGEKVILPTDFSLSSSRAFTRAMEMPKGVIKTMYLLHAIDPALTGEKLRRTEEGAEFHMRNLQAMAEQQGIVAKVVIEKGDAAHVVLSEIDERRATGVITGTRGRNAIQEALLGSVSMTVLRQASCPVMIVP